MAHKNRESFVEMLLGRFLISHLNYGKRVSVLSYLPQPVWIGSLVLWLSCLSRMRKVMVSIQGRINPRTHFGFGCFLTKNAVLSSRNKACMTRSQQNVMDCCLVCQHDKFWFCVRTSRN